MVDFNLKDTKFKSQAVLFRKLMVSVAVTETQFITILQSIVNVVSGIYMETLCIIIYLSCCILNGANPFIVISSSVVNHEFESQSHQAKDYAIGICWLSSKHTVLRSKSKYSLVRNLGSITIWCDISTRKWLFQ